MSLNRDSSPANLAFKNANNDRHRIASILPPFPESNQNQKMNNMDLDNLKEFRSRILEMDDEIKQLKNFEREKQMMHQRNDYQFPEAHFKPKPIQKDESISTTECLLQEQTNRISELERQFELLKPDSSRFKQGPINENSQETINSLIEYQNKPQEYVKELDDEISQRIGNWTSKDPYQGPMQNLYFPFGSSGGGAPRRDHQGKILTTLIGPQYFNANQEERKQKILASQFLQEALQQDMLQQRLKKLQDKQQNREPNGGFSELISNFKGGRPKRDPLTGMLVNNHLGSSDITNIKLATPRTISPGRNFVDSFNSGDNEVITYGMELTKAAKERQIMKHLDKLREQQECRQHVEAWNNMWGGRDKVNMQKNYSPSNSQNLSNHRNFYQIPNRGL